MLQATVTDQSQHFFPFINPSGEQWYFYLLSNHNCLGQLPVPSDTLDNRPPVVSPIESVTVEGGQTVVTWYPSPSPEVVGYVVYRQTDIGVVPIDTVFNGLSFTDPDAEPNTAPVSYFVNALDPCGNTSIFDAKHTSIFLEGEVIPCNQSVLLKWNRYDGWVNPIAEQQVWVGLNGGALAAVADAGGTASSFEVEDLQDEATYCFELRAVEEATGVVSKSNQICLTVDVVQPPLGMLLENVSVTSNNEVELTWQWDALAELTQYQVLRSTQNSAYQPIATQPISPPLMAVNNYIDNASGATGGKVFYKIETRDVCDSVRVSNYGSTIFLMAESIPGNINQLNWTAFDIENADVISYAIHKTSGGVDSEISTQGPAIITYADNYDPTNLNDAQACYYVVAKSQITTQNGEVLLRESHSNTACVEQSARIYAPNAFVPEGINTEFRPLIVLGDIASYELKVYDRYGQEVFRTDNPDEGWDGRKDGRNLAQGVYTYTIQLKQDNGKIQLKKGHVTLIR